jgi:hypothetical protein
LKLNGDAVEIYDKNLKVYWIAVLSIAYK